MPNMPRRYRLSLWLASAVALFCLCPRALAQCGRTVKAPDYLVCMPQDWEVWQVDREGKVELCGRAGLRPCASRPFGYPYPDAVFLVIMPSDRGYGIYQSSEELVAKARATGSPLPVISDVTLPRGDGGPERKCWVARNLMPGRLWQDVYTLTVGGRRFRVSVLYNDEKAKIESYREECLRVLSSITPLNTAEPKGGR